MHGPAPSARDDGSDLPVERRHGTGDAVTHWTTIHSLLPQTQCTRCGYADCAGYARALASGEADLNRCAPGGAEGVARLAASLGKPAKPLDPAYGLEKPLALAVIDEAWCIGCTKCLDACPIDAILGASKRMHTVMASHCTGCELCIPVCPVDCIEMRNESGNATGWSAWSQERASQALIRYGEHEKRMSRRERNAADSGEGNRSSSGPSDPVAGNGLPQERGAAPPVAADALPDPKRALIEAAMRRARALRAT
jgi:electron transport complex protein RnfB